MSDEGADIERLTLRLQGLNARDGELVARQVADSLAVAPAWHRTSDIKAQVTAEGAPEKVARSIVIELRRQLGVDR